MGNKVVYPGFTEEMLDDYATLTYLSRHEILSLLKKFYTEGKEQMEYDFHYRFPCENIVEWFPNLRCNPFLYRICEVFSSHRDACFSFEDMLDLCSVMSQNCPEKVKSKWAFRIFDGKVRPVVEGEAVFKDMDGDEKINEDDISNTLDLLVGQDREISKEDKEYIANILLEEINIQKTGGINELEFEHAVGKMSEFSQAFCFSI